MSELKGVMTLTEFETTREFLKCSDKQKVWLRTFITNDGDAVQATVTAFNCANLKNAQIYSYSVQRSPKVRAALNLYLGKTPLDVLLDTVRKNIKHAEPGSVAAQRLLAQEERLILGMKPSAEDEPEVVSKIEPECRIPAGATVWYDKTTGVVIGYRTRDGKDVQI